MADVREVFRAVQGQVMGARKLFIGETWYLVPAAWFEQWSKYASSAEDGSDADPSLHPGMLDYTSLMHARVSGTLREHMQEGVDYVFVAKEGYVALARSFGTTHGAQGFPRKVVNRGTATNSNLVVACYPQLVHLYAPVFPAAATATADASAAVASGAADAPFVTVPFATLALEPDETLKEGVLKWYLLAHSISLSLLPSIAESCAPSDEFRRALTRSPPLSLTGTWSTVPSPIGRTSQSRRCWTI
jgi:hypothetical protein